MEKEIRIRLIRHSELVSEDIERIIKLKIQYWHYTYESHYKWLLNNINDDEFHLLLENYSNNLIGYLNIVKVDVECDNNNIRHAGIGNVCVAKEFTGKGYGLLLMNAANFHINNINEPGMLLCKTNLIAFYIKANWVKYHGEVYLKEKLFNEHIFFNYTSNYKIICFNRNF